MGRGTYTPARVWSATLIREARLRAGLTQQELADRSGRFNIDAIAPGQYDVHAWNAFEPNSYFDRSFMQRFKNEGVAIQVSERSSATIQLNQIHVVR